MNEVSYRFYETRRAFVSRRIVHLCNIAYRRAADAGAVRRFLDPAISTQVDDLRPSDNKGLAESAKTIADALAIMIREGLDQDERLVGLIYKFAGEDLTQKEIADAAYKYQRELDTGLKTIVGVNKYNTEDEVTIPTLKIEERVETGQIEKLRELKRTRNNKVVRARLSDIVTAARNGDNLMPSIVDAVREYATLGEICDIFREVYGVYRDPGYF